MRLKAAVARAPGMPLGIEALDLADPGPSEILVRLVACGVSWVDRNAISGALSMPLPFVPGSEGAGIVERIGDAVSDLGPGDAVFVDYAACGSCPDCVAGHPRACEAFASQNLSGVSLEGASPFRGGGAVNGHFFGQSSFATHVICRADSAIKLPNDTPLEIVAAFGGETLTGFAAITEVFRFKRGDTLAITGAGVVGLIACIVAKQRGAGAIVMADPDERHRDLASECGATVAIHSDEELSTVVRSLDGDGATFALETTGRSTARRACQASLRTGGILGVSRPAWQTDESGKPEKHAILVDRTVNARTLIAELVDLHAESRFPLEPLVSFFSFEHVNAALTAFEEGRVLKPVLRFPLGAFDDLDRAKSGRAVGEAGDDPEPAPEADSERQPAESVKS